MGERFASPDLAAVRAADDVVLLVDEIDRIEMETEALLLEVLAELQVTIPELGTIRGTRRRFVLLTSNNSRELSEALRRRCLYLPLDCPALEREREILRARRSRCSSSHVLTWPRRAVSWGLRCPLAAPRRACCRTDAADSGRARWALGGGRARTQPATIHLSSCS
jgi:hypothetical protein